MAVNWAEISELSSSNDPLDLDARLFVNENPKRHKEVPE